MKSNTINPSSCRPSEGFVCAPLAVNNSRTQRPGMYSCYFSPFLQRAGLLIVGYQKIVSLIPRLHFTAGPTAILWCVGAVIVNAINGMIVRTFPHICKEVRKCIPSFANIYAACAIVFIPWLIRIKASHSHAFPYLIGRSSGHSVLYEMLPFRHTGIIHLYGA